MASWAQAEQNLLWEFFAVVPPSLKSNMMKMNENEKKGILIFLSVLFECMPSDWFAKHMNQCLMLYIKNVDKFRVCVY